MKMRKILGQKPLLTLYVEEWYHNGYKYYFAVAEFT